MKSYRVPCEECGRETKVKAQSQEALDSWVKLQHNEGKRVLCRKCWGQS